MAEARNVPVPLLVRRTGVDLEFVVADDAIDIGPELVATEFAARMPVKKPTSPPLNGVSPHPNFQCSKSWGSREELMDE